MVIGRRHSRGSHGISMLDKSQHIGNACDDFLLQSDDLHLLFTILEHSQLLLCIQQVKHLRAHTHDAFHYMFCEQNKFTNKNNDLPGLSTFADLVSFQALSRHRKTKNILYTCFIMSAQQQTQWAQLLVLSENELTNKNNYRVGQKN